MGACSSAEEARRESKRAYNTNEDPKSGSKNPTSNGSKPGSVEESIRRFQDESTHQKYDARNNTYLPRSKTSTMVDEDWDLGKLRINTIAPCPERGDLLLNVPVLNKLSEEERDILGGMMVERRFRPGKVVFSQGEIPDGFYVIIRGGARIEGFSTSSLKIASPGETSSDDNDEENQDTEISTPTSTTNSSNSLRPRGITKKNASQNKKGDDENKNKNDQYQLPEASEITEFAYTKMDPPANAFAQDISDPFEELVLLPAPKRNITVYAYLKKGDYFGETALLSNTFRTASIVSDPRASGHAVSLSTSAIESKDHVTWGDQVDGYIDNQSYPSDLLDVHENRIGNSTPIASKSNSNSKSHSKDNKYTPEDDEDRPRKKDIISATPPANETPEQKKEREEKEYRQRRREGHIRKQEIMDHNQRVISGEHFPSDEKELEEEYGHSSSNDLVTLYLCKDLFDSFFRAKLQETDGIKNGSDRKSKIISQRFADNIRTKLREQVDIGGSKVNFARRRVGIKSSDEPSSQEEAKMNVPEIARFNFPLFIDTEKFSALKSTKFTREEKLGGGKSNGKSGKSGKSTKSSEADNKTKDIDDEDNKSIDHPDVIDSEDEDSDEISTHNPTSTVKKVLLKALRNNAYLSKLDTQQQTAIVETMRRVQVPTNAEYIIKQGEVGVLLYILVQTPEPLKVYKNDKYVGRITPGSVFGELALLFNEQRAATVCAPEVHAERTELWAIDRFSFQRISRRVAEATVERVADFLSTVPLLQPLSSVERYKVAECVEERHFEAGSIIVRQGDIGNCLYLLVTGQCKAYKKESEVDTGDSADTRDTRDTRDNDEKKYSEADKKNNNSTEHPVYGEKIKEYTHTGEFFGEAALQFSDAKRKATIVAETYTILLKVTRTAFDLLLESPLRDTLRESIRRYGLHIEGTAPDGYHEKNIDDKNKIDSSISTQTNTKDISLSSFIDPYQRQHDKNIPEWTQLRAKGILGKGSFGVVRLVEDARTGEKFALKTLDKSKLTKPSQQKQVQNEIRLMKQLKHPFILSLHTTYRSSRHLHILLPLASEGDLFGLLRRWQFFPEEQARFYAGTIALALGYMHSKDIVYRDLKPENVLLWDDGYAKLADLGFAKKMENVNHRTWTVCGTPEYLSPEILAGRGHTKTADWWTLGIFIYEMLASHPPFTDKTQIGIFKAILGGNLRFPSHFSPQARALITALLSPSSSQRLGAGPQGTSKVLESEWFGMDNLDLGNFNDDKDGFYKKEVVLLSHKQRKEKEAKEAKEAKDAKESKGMNGIQDEKSKGYNTISKDTNRKRNPSAVFFDALRLHRIKAPAWKDERRVTALQRAAQTAGPNCGIPVSQAEVEEICISNATGKHDNEWDAEFGPKLNGVLAVL